MKQYQTVSNSIEQQKTVANIYKYLQTTTIDSIDFVPRVARQVAGRRAGRELASGAGDRLTVLSGSKQTVSTCFVSI
jgi:hypothetical protein